ncbi:TrmH family RNA methyltransferase, partial [Bordetella pertussis]
MTQAFSRVRFIMTQPSHPGNVGSAARAIKTMGFGELVLVAPRFPDMTAQPEAVALASGALDVLERAAVHDTLEEALAPVTLAFALTTRVRDLGPPPCDIREAA